MKVKIIKINKVELGEEEGGIVLEVDGVKKYFVLDGCWRCKGGLKEKSKVCLGDINIIVEGEEIEEMDVVCCYDDGEVM